MRNLNMDEVKEFVNSNISMFHENRIKSLKNQKLDTILKRKNPYLFKAKNINLAQDLVKDFLEAHLSSSEEKIFGDFFEELAIFVAEKTCDGRKSSATGVDLEFINDGVHYLVSIKSGTNWGNSSQHAALEKNLNDAVKVLKQSNRVLNVQPVLGICYGRTKTSFLRGYMKVVGQNFWYLISENENLYTDIIEPLGYRANEYNENFTKEKEKIINIFTAEFMDRFCKEGEIEWEKLVQFNSKNLDLKDN